MNTPPDRPSPASAEQVAHQYRCQAAGPHHYGDKCDGGRVQAPNAQFTRRCGACAGTGLDAPALAAALAAEREALSKIMRHLWISPSGLLCAETTRESEADYRRAAALLPAP